MARPTGEVFSTIKDRRMLGWALSSLWPDSGKISFIELSMKTTRMFY